jgi:polyhydroxyalkanoate synthase
MTREKEELPKFDPQQAPQNLARIAERSGQLVAGFLNRRQEINGMGMADPANVGKAFIDLSKRSATRACY